MPQQTSTVYLPRRSMLKLNPDILYKEVFTPSNLSPIRPMTSQVRKPIYTDVTTLHLDGSSAYQHYSVDATACVGHASVCRTLEGTEIDLSQRSEVVKPRQLFTEDEGEESVETGGKVSSRSCLEDGKETKLIHSNDTM